MIRLWFAPSKKTDKKRDMRYKRAEKALISATVLYGVALPLMKTLGPDSYTLLMWIAPAFFYLYESVFVWLVGRYERMKPQKMITTSLAMRGIKFLGVATMMFVWVVLKLPAKTEFLLYTLGYYLLTSLFEGWVAKAYAKEMSDKQ